MNIIIDFLEDSQYDWSMNFDKYDGFMQIASNFGYCFGISQTRSEVKNYLLEKIKENLKGENVSSNDFSKIKDHFAFKYFLSNRSHFIDAFKLIASIRFTINKLDSYTNSLNSWMVVREMLEAYLSISNPDYNYLESTSYDRHKTISNSIRFLNNKGYKISIKNGDVYLDEKDRKKLFIAINYRFKKLGFLAIIHILNSMSVFYDFQAGRYFLRRYPASSNNYEAHVPWGYLFNVGLANLKETKPSRASKQWMLEIIELTKHYFCLEQMQDFNQFSDINHNKVTILPAVQRNILYDQFFSLDQISIKHINTMMVGLFSCVKYLPQHVNLDIYLDILELVSSKSIIDKPLIFDAAFLRQELGYRYNQNEIGTAVEKLSFKVSQINNGYLIPEEIEKKNYFERPFILNGVNYIYISPIFCNYGFYCTILQICNENGVDDNVFGKMAEDFVGKQLEASGILFGHNKKYKIRKEIADLLKINSQEGECDFIIETESTIFFLELKRKTLTVEARKGNILHAIRDLAQSFLHALSQAGRHEFIIRKDGGINFKDGSKLVLKGRNIEKISLSLFDFYSMHDSSFIQQLLSNLINYKIESESKSNDKKINKIMSTLRHQYRAFEFLKQYLDSRVNFLNCRFLSVPQLLEVLEHSSDNETFKTELNRTKHAYPVVTG